MSLRVSIPIQTNFFHGDGIVYLYEDEMKEWGFEDPNRLRFSGDTKGLTMKILYGEEEYYATFGPDNYENLEKRDDGKFYNSSNGFRFKFPKDLKRTLDNEFSFSSYMIRVNDYFGSTDNKKQDYGEKIECEFEKKDKFVICRIIKVCPKDNPLEEVEVMGGKVTVGLCCKMEQIFRNSKISISKKGQQRTDDKGTDNKVKPYWFQPTDWKSYKENIRTERNTYDAVYMWIGKSNKLAARYLYIGIAGATEGSTGSVYSRLTAENKKFKDEIADDFTIVKYRYSQLHPNTMDAPIILKTVEMQTINEMNSLFKEAPGKPADVDIKNWVIDKVIETGQNEKGDSYPMFLLNDKKRYLQV